ncbi:MAG TPA: rRNA maturation RNase YbeY [Terriglobia bacterium]|jgi:probable rRNA maturation factor|nr:rRNA maturation RNase YbeY [Terriglobia bacterium]
MTGPVIVNRQRRYRIPVPRMQRFANTLARRLRIEHLEFSLVLSNDRAIRRLNRNFRQKDRSTDILSFPAQDPVPAGADLDNPYLGDMILSVETARRQAFDRNHTLERELCLLMIHGLLHLLGYNHEADRGEMRRMELRLQKELL